MYLLKRWMVGLLPKLQNGDLLRLDATTGELTCLNEAEVQARTAPENPIINQEGCGRESCLGISEN